MKKKNPIESDEQVFNYDFYKFLNWKVVSGGGRDSISSDINLRTRNYRKKEIKYDCGFRLCRTTKEEK